MIIWISVFHKHISYLLRSITGFNRKRIRGFIFLNWGTNWVRFFKLTLISSGSGVRDLYLSCVRHVSEVLKVSGCQWLSDVRITLKTNERSRPCASFLSSQLLCCGNHVFIFCVSSYNSPSEATLKSLHVNEQNPLESGEQIILVKACNYQYLHTWWAIIFWTTIIITFNSLER